ncbi:MAG: metallophosphoesterase [Candidatus Nanopelagicales bacterium]
MVSLGKAAIGVTALGAAALGYAHLETKRFTLRRENLRVLAPHSPDLRVLHLSDLHMVPGQHRKREWVQSLVALSPDAVVATGDFLSHEEGIPAALEALAPLLDIPGAFVLGSNDYYAPKPINPARYFSGPSQLEPKRKQLDWEPLVTGLSEHGWLNLTNASHEWKVDGRLIDVRGVDDPHIRRDDYGQVAGAFNADADLALGVVHAPYVRVLDSMSADGAQVILAGHTHGGQLRIPGYGALVTNCDLDTKRARGLSSYGDSLLHVSAGLGCSRYAPFRFSCPPEATLLTFSAATS